jgi:hypothetical protein
MYRNFPKHARLRPYTESVTVDLGSQQTPLFNSVDEIFHYLIGSSSGPAWLSRNPPNQGKLFILNIPTNDIIFPDQPIGLPDEYHPPQQSKQLFYILLKTIFVSIQVFIVVLSIKIIWMKKINKLVIIFINEKSLSMTFLLFATKYKDSLLNVWINVERGKKFRYREIEALANFNLRTKLMTAIWDQRE